MSYKLNQVVKIADVDKVNNDEFLDKDALDIIKESNYSGKVTKVEDDIYFVGFKNDLGWVTQGYRVDEIKEAE